MSWLDYEQGDTLDSALALAAERDVPLLALWSAAWCPPCNELQLMVFDDPQFARFHDSLVLLRIDGDAPGAQLVGERLGVRSYPTALLLDAQGREKLRLPGGLTAAEYGRALDLGMAHPVTLAALVERVQGGAPLGAADCELLAWHWWGVDDSHAGGEQRLPMLRRVRADCPHCIEDARLRLLVQMLIAAARGEGRLDEAHEVGEADALAGELLRALESPAARYSNLYFLIVDLSVLRVLGDAWRNRIEEGLSRAIEALLGAGTLATTERLIALSALLAIARRRASGPDDALRERVSAAARQADAESVTTAQRQTAVNMAGHLLKAAGFEAESLALFERETGRSPHAGYFWPFIAAAHFEQGRTDEAIASWRRAWQVSPPGCARRVRGAAYVAKLAEIRPQHRELIEREAMAVLHEIAPATDALAGQNRRSVASVLMALAVVGD